LHLAIGVATLRFVIRFAALALATGASAILFANSLAATDELRPGPDQGQSSDSRNPSETVPPAPEREAHPAITEIRPPEREFFAKLVSFRGIPIKASSEVSDQALNAAYDRLAQLLQHQPMVVSNLVAAGAELHIIGRHQMTTDLPEWRHDKGKPIAEYGGLTRDERTRGMGGRLCSCGEENLLKLQEDRYRGRDICLHEFSHGVRNFGIDAAVRKRFDDQYHRSLEKGLWLKSYAASNPDEFFAELTMWYFGTHGDRHMTGPVPADGPSGLNEYDPEAFGLFDDFFQGRIAVGRVQR
jgi:alpha-glucosidase